MTPTELAGLHGRTMIVPAAWSARDFAEILAHPATFIVGDPAGFAVGRAVADEAELLTLVVDPAQRRRGIARRCLEAFESEARSRGGATAFLEVAADNAPAIALYSGQGYVESGRRRGYYRRPDGTRCDALVMTRPLSP